MGDNSMSMRCLIVLYVCVIAHCLPFYEEGRVTDAGAAGDLRNAKTRYGKDVSRTYFNTGNKGQNDGGQTPGTQANPVLLPLETRNDDAVIHGKYTNLYKIANYILLKLHRHRISNMANQTKTTIEISDVNSTEDKVNMKDDTNVIGASAQKSPVTSNSVGFRRNSAPIPGHRKRRQRRSFFLDLGLADIFAEDVGDVIFSAHTSPCEHSDRHFCLNGGTCVYVAALGIKTCRCRIGYTGLRCEMINQEYILALLSNDIFG